ncbi:PAS domain S-box protein [Fibrisoma montanum]|uniref:histidine kinase n=1 Tax=Fibrisoma montanum TaxID=2305895 RepID=A0A418M0B0_9BACT|nr:ATP-binding protein [Fibrisoma montanum]RIV19016.1 PAS domain S-box protein [Fibrisoma montanum]
MQHPVFAPESGLSMSQEQASLWQQVLQHSVSGLVGFIAERDEAGQISNLRYSFINKVALRDTFSIGRQADEEQVIGRYVTDFFPTIRGSVIWRTYLDVIETGTAQRLEQKYTLNGRDVWIAQSVAPFGQDGLLLSYSETSELHNTAHRLTNQSALLNEILNSSPNAIAVFEAIRDGAGKLVDFRTTLVNRMVERLSGLPAHSFINTQLSQIHPLTPESFERLNNLLITGESVHVEHFVPGASVWLDVTLTRLNDGFVATLQDITAAKQAQQQLETAIQNLHRSNQHLEEFAYVASHDLQEPLRKIVAFGDVLQHQYADQLSLSATDLVGRMQKSANRMRSLVNDLLTYARLSNKPDGFGLVDLNHLIASVADDLEVTIQDKQAEVTLDTLPTVWGDTVLLRQLFQNLLSNGLKFHQPGQAPVVRIEGHVATPDECRTYLSATDASQAGRRYALIDVVDKGVGFDERYLDRIFTIFQRLHPLNQYVGTGMGLAICRKVVDIHGGHITAISQPGHGAIFRLLLPMQ